MSEKMRVLVVDDSRVIRKAFARILGEQYDLSEAGDGEEAWDVLKADDEICAVFTDLNMPHLNGHGLLARIRESDDEEIKNLPVIVVTAGEDDAEGTKDALTAGATDYVLKPFDSVFLQSKAKAYVKPREKAMQDSQAVTTDPLTRLPNREFFIERGEQEMSAANRHTTELALLLIGLDKYRELHEQTEARVVRGLIRKLGSYLSSEVRLEDTVARVERDRFAILLADSNLQDAIDMGERLRHKISHKTIRYKDQSFKISISVGVSALPPDIRRTFNMLLMDADRRLREVIGKGGNAVLPRGDAGKRARRGDSDIASLLAEAVAILSRQENKKPSAAEAEKIIKQLLPLLEYSNETLDLELGDTLDRLKKKYS